MDPFYRSRHDVAAERIVVCHAWVIHRLEPLLQQLGTQSHRAQLIVILQAGRRGVIGCEKGAHSLKCERTTSTNILSPCHTGGDGGLAGCCILLLLPVGARGQSRQPSGEVHAPVLLRLMRDKGLADVCDAVGRMGFNGIQEEEVLPVGRSGARRGRGGWLSEEEEEVV